MLVIAKVRFRLDVLHCLLGTLGWIKPRGWGEIKLVFPKVRDSSLIDQQEFMKTSAFFREVLTAVVGTLKRSEMFLFFS